MVQSSAKWAGPINFGVHLSTHTPYYLDIHLPYTVITIGNIHSVEYPNDWGACSRDISTGVKYDRGNERPDKRGHERLD